MAPWSNGKSDRTVPLDVVGKLTPKEVLYDFDGPCIFTAETAFGTLVLAYLAEDLEEERRLRYIVSTTSPATIEDMKRGALSVREALRRGSVWIVDFDYALDPKDAWSIAFDEIPDDILPVPGTMLWPHLEPGLCVKLDGEDIREGSIPASVFLQAAEIAAKAFKPIFEWAARDLREFKDGRPPNWLRDLYGLPTQRVAFGSLEVAFGRVDVGSRQTQLAFPEILPTVVEIQEAAWEAVREGLQWAIGGESLPAEHDTDKWLAILESLKRIAPPSTGAVSNVHVSGNLVGRTDRPITLSRRSTKRIRDALTDLKRRQPGELRLFKGRVRELDLDQLTMILRGVEGDPNNEVSFELEDDSLLEIARDAHYHQIEVVVAAQRTDKNIWTVARIEFSLPENTSDIGEPS